MIPLIVALALCFAWACVATAIAVSENALFQDTRNRLESETARADALLDRLQSSSLGEYHAARRIAMQAPEPQQEGRYLYDPTGLVRVDADAVDAPE